MPTGSSQHTVRATRDSMDGLLRKARQWLLDLEKDVEEGALDLEAHFGHQVHVHHWQRAAPAPADTGEPAGARTSATTPPAETKPER